MAKGKYEYWLTEEGLLLIQGWARDGLTDEDIAHNMGIRRSTLNEWKNKFSVISDTLKSSKEVADRKVENALFKKTLGFVVQVQKTFKTKHVEYDPDTGHRLSEHEILETALDDVYIPPDTTAQIFWLKNRLPQKWRDRKETEISGSLNTNQLTEEQLEDQIKKLEKKLGIDNDDG